jgi:hypothetical protein
MFCDTRYAAVLLSRPCCVCAVMSSRRAAAVDGQALYMYVLCAALRLFRAEINNLNGHIYKSPALALLSMALQAAVVVVKGRIYTHTHIRVYSIYIYTTAEALLQLIDIIVCYFGCCCCPDQSYIYITQYRTRALSSICIYMQPIDV